MKSQRITITTIALVVFQLCSGLFGAAGTEDEGELRWPSYFPENAELYEPEPIPNPSDSGPELGAHAELMMALPGNQVVSYNALTGEEVVLDVTHGNMPLQAFSVGSEEDGEDGIEASDEQLRLLNLAALHRVANPQDHPWRVNCKLYYEKGGRRYSASGVLIGCSHVLTAGHCVHEGNGGDWVTSMVVVPGYENGSSPFGSARGVNYISWTGWTLYGDTDHDIGVIELDRPAGALAGWRCYGYDSNPSFYTGNDFWVAGYSGEHMYYWNGSFDYTGNVGGHWRNDWLVVQRSFYDGMGGSGAYHRDVDNSRCIYAVLSSENSSGTYFARITPNKFHDIQDEIRNCPPAEVDLMPLGVEVSPQTVCAGSRISSMSYLVHNHSRASWTGTVSVQVYLSTNDNISTLDRIIDRHTFSHSFAPESSVTIDVSDGPMIPADIASGRYHVGVILDVSDSNTSNNDSDGQDAAEITVEPDPPIFGDQFPSRIIDRSKWWTVDGAAVDDTGIGEPSRLYSLRLNGKDEIWSRSLDLDLGSFASARLVYYYQRTGGGESPDPEDNLIFEYWNGWLWRYLDHQSGSGSDMTYYDRESVPLPPDALHTGFKFRIRSTGDQPDFDDWFVDDISVKARRCP